MDHVYVFLKLVGPFPCESLCLLIKLDKQAHIKSILSPNAHKLSINRPSLWDFQSQNSEAKNLEYLVQWIVGHLWLSGICEHITHITGDV